MKGEREMPGYKLVPITYDEGKAITAIKVMQGEKIITGYWLKKGQITRFWGEETDNKTWQIVSRMFLSFPLTSKSGFIPVANPKEELKTIYQAHLFHKFATSRERPRFKTLARYGLVYLTQGWLRIRTWEKEEDENKKIIWIPKYAYARDLNVAIRMQDHVLERYWRDSGHDAGEIKKLNELGFLLGEIIWTLTSGPGTKKKREQAGEEILKAIGVLENSREIDKLETLGALVDAASLTDRLYRFNPAATAVRIRYALNHLGIRLNSIGAIAPIIAMRRELLRYEMNCLEAERVEALFRLDTLTEWSRKGAMAKEENEVWQRNINRIIFNVYRFWVSPYFPVHDRVVKLLEEARECLRLDDNQTIAFNATLAKLILEELIPRD
jgi:hypothetical protein